MRDSRSCEPSCRRVERDRDERDGGNDDHDGGLIREVGRVHQPERGARILNVREVEHVGDDRPALVERQQPFHEQLRDLVEGDDRDDNRELEGGHDGSASRVLLCRRLRRRGIQGGWVHGQLVSCGA